MATKEKNKTMELPEVNQGQVPAADGDTPPPTVAEPHKLGKTGKVDPYEELAQEYAKRYPDNDTFHITSDRQVFLKRDRNLATMHQSGLKTNDTIHTINVKRK